MKVTEMMTNDQRKQFIKWGIKSKCYILIGRIFKSTKYINMSVYYLDKRWELMDDVLRKHGYE